jgi:hypothetical protein
MPKPFTEWTVLPHGKLLHLEDDVLSVVGKLHMPLGDYPRRMTVVRLMDGRLVIYSAIALDEAEMEELESFGRPSYLVVPNELHRLDAKIWKDRYPQLVVVAPSGVRDKVEDVVHVDCTTVDFRDPRVSFVTVPGIDEHEAALLIRSTMGTTLVVGDLIWNLDDRPGFGGWIMKALGFTGDEPKIPPLVKMRRIKDKDALRDQLEAWSQIGDLQRIVVAHGDVVTRDPAGALRHMAQQLSS